MTTILGCVPGIAVPSAAGSSYWSDIYIFFTDQKPGVTASLPIIADDGEFRGVLGLDIDLEQLSAFLASLQIGRSGRAMIIDEAGRLRIRIPKPLFSPRAAAASPQPPARRPRAACP